MVLCGKRKIQRLWELYHYRCKHEVTYGKIPGFHDWQIIWFDRKKMDIYTIICIAFFSCYYMPSWASGVNLHSDLSCTSHLSSLRLFLFDLLWFIILLSWVSFFLYFRAVHINQMCKRLRLWSLLCTSCSFSGSRWKVNENMTAAS